MYFTNRQPNFSYSVNMLSRFKQEPRESHWNSAKRVLRYIQGTKYFGLLYKRNTKFTLVGYSNVDFVGDIDDKTSTSGYLMNMDSTKVSWNCKSQTTMVNSSAEVEYISSWEATCEIVWLCRILQGLGETHKSLTNLLIDSESSINMSKNSIFHPNTKHVEPSITSSDRSSSQTSSSLIFVHLKIKLQIFLPNLLVE
jgi:hypothetical protein